MSLRSENVDVNPVLLFAPAKSAVSSDQSVPVYYFPDDEDSHEGSKNAFADIHENAGSSDVDAATSADTDRADETAGPSAASSAGSDFNPMLLPAGYGGAIIAAFLAMIEYLNKMAQQGYEVTVASANAMIGTNGQPGMIQRWVQAGCDAAEKAGEQTRDQAIGALVGAIVAGASLIGMGVGFARNCTDFFGMNGRSEVSGNLANANAYKNMLEEPSNANKIGQSKTETVPMELEMKDLSGIDHEAVNQRADQKEVEVDTKAELRKKELIEGVGIDKYKAANGKSRTPDQVKADEDTRLAAQHMSDEERIAAKEKADKKVDSLNNQLQSYEQKQRIWTDVLQQVSSAGSNAGQGAYGILASDAQTESGKDKATADAMQQAGQTTESVKEKATSAAQADRESMSQMAQALAQALAAQVQSRG